MGPFWVKKRHKLLRLPAVKSTTEHNGQDRATTGPAAYSDFRDGKGEKLEFLADAGRKPRSVKFHTVRPCEG
jgi:hypothetical protein